MTPNMVLGKKYQRQYALTDTIDVVTYGLEDLDNVALVSIYLQKAFDTLNHDNMIRKCNFYGFMSTALF